MQRGDSEIFRSGFDQSKLKASSLPLGIKFQVGFIRKAFFYCKYSRLTTMNRQITLGIEHLFIKVC